MSTRTYRAHAFLEAAERLGVQVVVGSDQAQVLAAANPRGNLTLDFLDTGAASRKIVEFAGRSPIQAVIAADDDGVVLAATAAAALGLRHNPVEAVAAARDKHRMRQILAASGVPSPRFWCLSIDEDAQAAAHRVEFPCVLKPLFLSGSRGVIRANDAMEFAAAFKRIAAILRQPAVAAEGGELAEKILVESFIPGGEVALEGLLSGGKLRVLAIFDKPDPLDGPFFQETIYVTPSRLPEHLQEEVAARTQEAITALALTEGPVHAELRINDFGVWILELAPRSIGGLCSRTLRFDDGMTLEELILRHALGFDVESCQRERQAAGVMMIPIQQAGTLRQVRGKEDAEAVPGIEDVRISISLG